MKFKVDENLPREIVALLEAAGHDAATVLDQGMRGHPDARISSVCRREARALITLDLDFCDITAYPPEHHAGIIVLRLARQDKPLVLATFARLLPLLLTQALAGRLWVVEEDRVRCHDGSGARR
jgi:predicted nuclease of predicted toxin-antitoxin system